MPLHILCAIGLATVMATPPAPPADLQTIIDGERAWGQTYVHGDAATIDRLLAADFIGVLAMSFTQNV